MYNQFCIDKHKAWCKEFNIRPEHRGVALDLASSELSRLNPKSFTARWGTLSYGNRCSRTVRRDFLMNPMVAGHEEICSRMWFTTTNVRR